MKLEFLKQQFVEWCGTQGWEIEETHPIPHGMQVTVYADGTRCPVNFYQTGRALVQGPPSELRDRIAEWVRLHAVAPADKKARRPAQLIPQFPNRVGIDESGKGDYFGPLVITAAFASADDTAWLLELGVKDSKKLADSALLKLASEIRDAVPHETIIISPPRYNGLHAKMKNLNRLLAWGHARSLESLLERVDAGAAISDQFGDKSYLQKALMEKGRGIELIQMPRAEEDAAVAAASVFARSAFLRSLRRMEDQYQMRFSKGASDLVEREARDFVKQYGVAKLGEVAKLHFKTTGRVIPQQESEHGEESADHH